MGAVTYKRNGISADIFVFHLVLLFRVGKPFPFGFITYQQRAKQYQDEVVVQEQLGHRRMWRLYDKQSVEALEDLPNVTALLSDCPLEQ